MNMGLKILVLHEVSYKNKVIYEYQDFAERLVAMGHSVRVIDFDEASGGVGGSETLTRTGLGSVFHETLPFADWPVIKYLSARAAFKSRLKHLLKNKEVDVIFLYSVAVNGVDAVRLARRWNVPVVYRVLDVYHKLRQDPWIRWPLYFGEKFIYRNCDAISLTNEKMREYILAMAGSDAANKCSVLHHGVDTKLFCEDAGARGKILSETKWSDTSVINLFLGTTYTFSGLKQIVAGWGDFVRAHPSAKLLVVGPGDLTASLQVQVNNSSLRESVQVWDSRPYAEVPGIIGGSDVCLLPFEINEITRDIIPIKILQYLSCAKPVLSTPLPDLKRLFPESVSGMMYQDISNSNKFMEKMSELNKSEALRSGLGKSGRAFIETGWSLDAQMKALENTLLHEVERARARRRDKTA